MYGKMHCQSATGGQVKWFMVASLPGRVIVVHLTADKPKSISFTAYYTSPQFIGYRFALFNYSTKNAGGLC
jgi:hypothetical protein